MFYRWSLVIWAGLLLTFVALVKGQYEDVRCKCVCQSSQNNATKPSKPRNIFVKSFHEPSMCKCENVVDKVIQESDYHFCDRCDCQWQRRNTTTIKVVVLFIICVVSLLFLYMLFLLCLDPLMSRRPQQPVYTEQRNEEIMLYDLLDVQPPISMERPVAGMSSTSPGVISRVKHEVRRVRGEQERWKDTVSEQRKNIYDRHTMLN